MAIDTSSTASTAATTDTPARKKGLDVYTWMVILSVVFLGIGCGMLVLELARYDFQLRPVNF